MDSILPIENIASKIYVIRKQRVMLDRDLAILYGVETKVLNQAVKRNLDRFPEDCMFQFDEVEWGELRSQFVTSKETRGGRQYLPYAFTELGVAMLSSVLNSNKAIQINLLIMRVFTKLRNLLASNDPVQKCSQFSIVNFSIRQLVA